MCKHTRTELKPLLLTTTQHAVVACHANADTGSKASCPGLFECVTWRKRQRSGSSSRSRLDWSWRVALQESNLDRLLDPDRAAAI